MSLDRMLGWETWGKEMRVSEYVDLFLSIDTNMSWSVEKGGHVPSITWWQEGITKNLGLGQAKPLIQELYILENEILKSANENTTR